MSNDDATLDLNKSDVMSAGEKQHQKKKKIWNKGKDVKDKVDHNKIVLKKIDSYSYVLKVKNVEETKNQLCTGEDPWFWLAYLGGSI